MLFEALHPILGDRVSKTDAIRDQHSRGEGLPHRAPPDLVAFPTSNEEVATIVRLCAAHRIPVVPFGTGTGLEGHVAALEGGITIDLTRMDQILELSPDSMDCRVQAGVTRETLNLHLRSTGLFFSVDPGADASIGGMAATRASGTTAVRYGTMRENVLGLTVVTPSGEIIRTGTRARKSSSGLDLTRLYVGSEGTLGVITEIQLRLQPLPESVVAAVCQFPNLRAAMETVFAVLQSAIPVARIELANAQQMDASIQHSHLDEFEPLPTLFLEFAGSERATEEQALAVQEIAAEAGGSRFAYASRPEDRTRLWKARHAAYYAQLHYRPGRSVMSTDACVPIGSLTACIEETEADIAETGLPAPLIGHVGDGNFHLGIIFDPADAGEVARAEGLARRTGERAIRFGGTCSGEHGIGMHKRGLAALEHGNAASVMWAIKHALDPDGIMNPGKLLPLPA